MAHPFLGQGMKVSRSALLLALPFAAIHRVGFYASAEPMTVAESFLGVLPSSEQLGVGTEFGVSTALESDSSYLTPFSESYDESGGASGILPSFPFPIFRNDSLFDDFGNNSISDSFSEPLIAEPAYDQASFLDSEDIAFEQEIDHVEEANVPQEVPMQFAGDLSNDELEDLFGGGSLFHSGWTFGDRLPERLRPIRENLGIPHNPELAAVYADGNAASMIDAIAEEEGEWDESLLFGDVLLTGAQAPVPDEHPTTGEPDENDPYAIPPPKVPEGVFTICYAANEAEILTRCAKAKDHGTGIIIQMLDASKVEPLQEPEVLGEDVDEEQQHKPPKLQYEKFVRKLPASWYSNVRQLKSNTGLTVMGLWFGPPNYELMHEILRENPGIFDGIQVDWEAGVGACVDKLTPPQEMVNGEVPEWVSDPDFTLTYYNGGQDSDVCVMPDGSPYDWDVFANKPDRGLPIPNGWIPIFPCYGGTEGRCYQAFTMETAIACDVTQQRYAFAPHDRVSGSLLNLLNEACFGLGKKLPPHDLVMAI